MSSGGTQVPRQVWRAPFWWLYRMVSLMFGVVFVAALIGGLVERDGRVLAVLPVFAIMNAAFYAPSIPRIEIDDGVVRIRRVLSRSEFAVGDVVELRQTLAGGDRYGMRSAPVGVFVLDTEEEVASLVAVRRNRATLHQALGLLHPSGRRPPGGQAADRPREAANQSETTNGDEWSAEG